MKVSELTQEQVAQMSVVRQEYLDLFFSLEFKEENLPFLKSFVYGDRDVPVFVMDSPYGCQVAANNFQCTGEDILDNIADDIWENARINIGGNISCNIGDNIRGNIWDSIRENVKANVQYHFFSRYLDSSDYYVIAYYDYFIRTGLITLNQEVQERFDHWKKAAMTNTSLNLFFENVAFISKPPIKLTRNNEGLLHNLDSAAVIYADGYEQHYVDGCYFSKDDFERAFIKKELTATQVLEEDNSERKALYIQYCLSFDKMNQLEGYTELDRFSMEWNDSGKFIEYVLFDYSIESVPLRALRVQWYEQGKMKETLLGIDQEPDTDNVIGAWCWTFPSTWEKYKKGLINQKNFKKNIGLEA